MKTKKENKEAANKTKSRKRENKKDRREERENNAGLKKFITMDFFSFSEFDG